MKFFTIILSLSLMGCITDKATLENTMGPQGPSGVSGVDGQDGTSNDVRVSALEALVALNFEQDDLLEARVSALEVITQVHSTQLDSLDVRVEVLESQILSIASLQTQINNLTLALSNYISSNDLVVSNLVNDLNSLTNTVNSLTLQITLNTNAISSIQNDIIQVIGDINTLETNYNILVAQLNALQDQMDNLDIPTVSPIQITALLDPCGDSVGVHDEILIKLSTPNGVKVLASFSNNVAGDYTRFSLLQPGTNYITTDNSSCFFSINANGELYNEHY